MPRRAGKSSQTPAKERPPEILRRLINVAMEFERRTMQVYCRFESLFREPQEVRKFWLEMAEHEARHFGGLALVAGLLEVAPERSLPAAPHLKREHLLHLRDLLNQVEAEAAHGVTLTRALEIALAIEGSEIEDLVLDLLMLLKGETERERATRLLIHDLGDLSYMVETYGRTQSLLARADAMIEQRLVRLRGSTAAKRMPARSPAPRRRRAARA
jgi:rubrerythrin